MYITYLYVKFIIPNHHHWFSKFSNVPLPLNLSISLSGQLGDQGCAHLEKLHGVVAGDEALPHLHNLWLLDGGAHLQALALLLYKRLKVQQVALVIHLVQLQGHLHKFGIRWILAPNLKCQIRLYLIKMSNCSIKSLIPGRGMD